MRKYTLNENFFSSWTPEMAYMLGFILADGCLHKKKEGINTYVLSIQLHSKDRHILESFNKQINSNRPIYTRPADNSGKWNKGESSILNINSYQIAQDLMKLGIHPQKSWTAEWPTDYPKEFMSHYVRGVFCGDGSVFLIKHPSQKSKYIGINFTGSEKYLLGLKTALEEVIDKPYGYMRALKVKNGTYYQLVYSGAATVKKLMDWMYQDSTPETRLKRKYDIYINFFSKLNSDDLKQNNVINKSNKESIEWIINAFGEEKNLTEWSKDSRCIVSRQALYHRIFKQKLNPEQAITLPQITVHTNHAPNKPSNNSKINQKIANKIRNLKNKSNLTNQQISDKLNISINIINDVISGRTWIDNTYNPTPKLQTKYYNYNNQNLTLTEISKLSGIPKGTIDDRLRKGLTIEEATSAKIESKPYNLPEISCAGLTKEIVTNIRTDYYSGLKGEKLYQKYSLTKSRAMDILLNRTWKEETTWWKSNI